MAVTCAAHLAHIMRPSSNIITLFSPLRFLPSRQDTQELSPRLEESVEFWCVRVFLRKLLSSDNLDVCVIVLSMYITSPCPRLHTESLQLALYLTLSGGFLIIHLMFLCP